VLVDAFFTWGLAHRAKMFAIRRGDRAVRDGRRSGLMREGSERSMRVLFPFAPLVASEWVSHFLLSSRIGAWPCLGAGPLGQPRQLKREVEIWVTNSPWHWERLRGTWERVARTMTGSAMSWST
jgi:hypothetical protein